MNEPDTIYNGFLPQRHKDVQSFFAFYGITPGKTRLKGLYWRLTDRVKGHIFGEPNSYGILEATDGVMCYISRGGNDAGTFFCGHMKWFERDLVECPLPFFSAKAKNPSSGPRTHKEPKIDLSLYESI